MYKTINPEKINCSKKINSLFQIMLEEAIRFLCNHIYLKKKINEKEKE